MLSFTNTTILTIGLSLGVFGLIVYGYWLDNQIENIEVILNEDVEEDEMRELFSGFGFRIEDVSNGVFRLSGREGMIDRLYRSNLRKLCREIRTI